MQLATFLLPLKDNDADNAGTDDADVVVSDNDADDDGVEMLSTSELTGDLGSG